MLTPNAIAVLVLAVYRATRFVTKDSMTSDLRSRLYAWAWNDDAGRAPEPIARSTFRTYVYEGLTCSFCLGVWVAALLYGVWRTGGETGKGVCVVLAIAGGQAFLASRNDA